MKAAVIIPVVLLLINLYLFQSMRWKLAAGSWMTVLLSLFFFGFYVLQLAAPMLDWSLAPIPHTMDGPAYRALVQSSYLALGVVSCLAVYSVAADVVGLILVLFVGAQNEAIVGRLLALIVVGSTAGTALIGNGFAGQVEVNRVDLRLANLPEAYEGFTIAQISDLHIGPHLKKEFSQTIAEELVRLRPDALVLTGDIADGMPDMLLPELMPLSTVSPPYGKYYVTGNHEYYWGASLWTDAVRRLGFRVLTNENVVFNKEGAALALAGVPDVTSMRMQVAPYTDPAKAKIGIPVGTVSILLSHQPKTYQLAKAAGFSAQISGHTHAGQYFPFTVLIKFFEPFTHGLYDLGGITLYVNKGAGFWGPPLRTCGPGEITLIRLVKG